MVVRKLNKPYDVGQVSSEIESLIKNSLEFWRETLLKLWLQPGKMFLWPSIFSSDEVFEIYRENGIEMFAMLSFPTPFIELSSGDFKIWEVYFAYIDGRISKNRVERFCKYDLRELRELTNEMEFTATIPHTMRNTTTVYLIGPRVAKSTPCKLGGDFWVFSMNSNDITRKICLNLSNGIRRNLEAWDKNKKHSHYEDQIEIYEMCLRYADDLRGFANPASNSRPDDIKAEDIHSKLDLLCNASPIVE